MRFEIVVAYHWTLCFLITIVNNFNVDVSSMKHQEECDSEFGYSLIFNNLNEIYVGAPTKIWNNSYFDGAVYSLSTQSNTYKIYKVSPLYQDLTKDARFGHNMVKTSDSSILVCAPYGAKNVCQQKSNGLGYCFYYKGYCESSDPQDGKLVWTVNKGRYSFINSFQIDCDQNEKYTFYNKKRTVSIVQENVNKAFESPNIKIYYHDGSSGVFSFDSKRLFVATTRDIDSDAYIRMMETENSTIISSFVKSDEVDSGYGHTMCNMPLNDIGSNPDVNDYLLIVGAPFDHEGGINGGAVYYLIFNEKPNNQLIARGKAGSMLGYTVFCPGDIDGNGYHDLIVSAPHIGEENRAEIVIFLRNGLNFVQSQTISPESNELTKSCYKMFGISFGIFFNVKDGNRIDATDSSLAKLAVGSLGTVFTYNLKCSYTLEFSTKIQSDWNFESSNPSDSTSNDVENSFEVCIKGIINCYADSNFQFIYRVTSPGTHGQLIKFKTSKRVSALSRIDVNMNINTNQSIIKEKCQSLIGIIDKSKIGKGREIRINIEDVTSSQVYERSPFSMKNTSKTFRAIKLCDGQKCKLRVALNVTSKQMEIVQKEDSKAEFTLIAKIMNVPADSLELTIEYDSRIKFASRCDKLIEIRKESMANATNYNLVKECKIMLDKGTLENAVLERTFVFVTSNVKEKTKMNFKFTIKGLDGTDEAIDTKSIDMNQVLCAGMNISISPQIESIDLQTSDVLEAINRKVPLFKILKFIVYVSDVGDSQIGQKTIHIKYPNITYINQICFDPKCCTDGEMNSEIALKKDGKRTLKCNLINQVISRTRQQILILSVNISLVKDQIPLFASITAETQSNILNFTVSVEYDQNKYDCEKLKRQTLLSSSMILLSISNVTVPNSKPVISMEIIEVVAIALILIIIIVVISGVMKKLQPTIYVTQNSILDQVLLDIDPDDCNECSCEE